MSAAPAKAGFADIAGAEVDSDHDVPDTVMSSAPGTPVMLPSQLTPDAINARNDDVRRRMEQADTVARQMTVADLSRALHKSTVSVAAAASAPPPPPPPPPPPQAHQPPSKPTTNYGGYVLPRDGEKSSGSGGGKAPAAAAAKAAAAAAVAQKDEKDKRPPPPRLLSGKDNVRISRSDFDEAFKWITARCVGGKITDRHLKEQVFSVFGPSSRWTRKEFALLASDPDLTADKLWRQLPLDQKSSCNAYDTIAEAFSAFDEDGDGFVDVDVMHRMWVQLFKERPSAAHPLPDSHLSQIDPNVLALYLQIADADDDGHVGLEDFREYAKKARHPMM